MVLLANAGCSTGYFDHLASVLVAGGFQAISIDMRGVGEMRGSLDGATLHDLAGDVAGVIKAIGKGPVHLVGHAFGNRIARYMLVDQPSLVRSVTLLAAGGLIVPSTPLGTAFRNATQAKMNGSDCVTGHAATGQPSDPGRTGIGRMLARRSTSRISRPAGTYSLEYWWERRHRPLLCDSGALDDKRHHRGLERRCASKWGERVWVVYLPHAGHFLLLEQPGAVARAVSGVSSRIPRMTDIILHHYDISPYSRKFGPGLASRALPGHRSLPGPSCRNRASDGADQGYRKTPVLQIGADIYCDSQLIMRELERRIRSELYPAGHGAADALAWWAEKTTFSPAAGILFAKKPDALPAGFSKTGPGSPVEISIPSQ